MTPPTPPPPPPLHDPTTPVGTPASVQAPHIQTPAPAATGICGAASHVAAAVQRTRDVMNSTMPPDVDYVFLRLGQLPTLLSFVLEHSAHCGRVVPIGNPIAKHGALTMVELCTIAA